MARPTKSEAEKRTLIMKVRVTATEKNKLENDASQGGFNSVSDYMRVKSIGSTPKPKKATPEREALIKGLAELAKMGSNLNQITKAINGSRLSVGFIMPHLYDASINQVEELSARLVNILDNGH